ncbi:MAG: DUF1559 domain-containing protein [Planctomycetaceae bacterium]|nr:DUF1559 domain-containing protein [Planctomycetaceae bacterium]
MQCVNNLKQIGLGIHNHHDALGVLPTNSTMQKDGMFAYYSQDSNNGGAANYYYGRLNYIVAILPYMEQTQLYEDVMIDQYTAAGNGGSVPAAVLTRLTNTEALSPWFKQIPGIRCPSDGAPFGPGSATFARVGRNNYMASSGDWPESHAYPVRKAANIASYIENPRGAFPMKNVSTDGGKTFTKTDPKSFGQVHDGTSNTVAVAEKCVGIVDSSKTDKLELKRAVVTNSDAVANAPVDTNMTEDPADVGVPSLCFGATVAHARYLVVPGYGDMGGIRWADGVAPYASFSTILPPNSPSCAKDGAEPLGRVLSSASSNHTGGVNALRFDGSVGFISDNISVNSGEPAPAGRPDAGKTGLDRLAVRTGPSPYGVWGALGSINGGEVRIVP